MKPRVCIVSECFNDNLGDQAIAEAVSGILRSSFIVSKASFGRIKTGSKDTPDNIDIKAGRLSGSRLINIVPTRTKAHVKWNFLGEKKRFSEHFRSSIAGNDLIILGGGQLIKDNAELFCEKIALVAKLSKALSIPFALVGVGADAGMHKMNWRVMKYAISNASFTILRGDMSRSRIEAALSCDKCVTVVPDLAFALGNPARERAFADRNVSLAVNLMDLSSMLRAFEADVSQASEDFIAGLCEIITATDRSEASITIFTSGAIQDLRAAGAIKNRILEMTGVDLPVFHPESLTELLLFLSNVRDVIATRMHAGILAYVSGCNPLCVSWDSKVQEVWSAIHQSMRVIGLNEIASTGAAARISKQLRNLSHPSCDELDSLSERISCDVLGKVSSVLEQSIPKRGCMV